MPAPKQQNTTLEELNQLVWRHMEERDWHENPSRGLAISLALEAGELLEHYQWNDQPVGGRGAVAEELADILIYAMQLAQRNSIDIAAEITKKLEKAAKKYPAKDFKGKDIDQRRANWQKNKLAYKKTGL